MRQTGVALVLVLWVISLLIIMAGSFALSMRRESSVTAVIKSNSQAAAVAESGLAIAELMLLDKDVNKAWRADGSIYEVLATGAKIRIRLLAEAGKIDINKADLRSLKNLLINAPADEEQQSKLLGAILDWRDPDDLVNINGAEKAEYEEAGLSYAPRNKPFDSIEELQLVLGMDKRVYAWLEPLVTVYSGQPLVNFKVATREVLRTIPDFDGDMIDTYLIARIDSARNDLPSPPLPMIPGLRSGSGGNNNVVTVVSEAILADNSRAAISVVIKKAESSNANPFQVLRWQHTITNNKSLFTNVMNDFLVKQYAQPELNN
ncbi:MAG: type II secretion system protein GspK [Methylococcales bacterium]|nr:type II secretion system protein GspK [Methylococcales bacterium]